MKRILYSTLLSCIMLGSCANVQKLVDQGNYDEAINLAARKLSGKKNKKTKHVKALERAFIKVMNQDLERIRYLGLEDSGDSWGEAYWIYHSINKRQETIAPFLPLISKDGYVAHFKMINVSNDMADAAQKAGALYYTTGREQLTGAKLHNDKLLARQANRTLEQAKSFDPSIRDLEFYLSESIDLGTNHILLKAQNEFLPTYNWVGKIRSNNRWTQYYYHSADRTSYDFIASLIVQDVTLSPEQEVINREFYSKEIESWKDITNSDGSIATDTLGNVIQEKVIEIREAQVTQIERSKSVILSGSADIRDAQSGKSIISEPLQLSIDFYSEAYRVRGDQRALPERIRNSRRQIENFPSDIDLILQGQDEMIIAYENILDRYLD